VEKISGRVPHQIAVTGIFPIRLTANNLQTSTPKTFSSKTPPPASPGAARSSFFENETGERRATVNTPLPFAVGIIDSRAEFFAEVVENGGGDDLIEQR
jgi:hypothetical protein